MMHILQPIRQFTLLRGNMREIFWFNLADSCALPSTLFLSTY